MPEIGDLVRHNQMMLRIHRRLNVVAHYPGAAATGRHRASIRIGEGELFIGRGEHRRFMHF